MSPSACSRTCLRRRHHQAPDRQRLSARQGGYRCLRLLPKFVSSRRRGESAPPLLAQLLLEISPKPHGGRARRSRAMSDSKPGREFPKSGGRYFRRSGSHTGRCAAGRMHAGAGLAVALRRCGTGKGHNLQASGCADFRTTETRQASVSPPSESCGSGGADLGTSGSRACPRAGGPDVVVCRGAPPRVVTTTRDLEVRMSGGRAARMPRDQGLGMSRSREPGEADRIDSR